MAIQVCDSIMGSGKSCAAIRYMNEHPDRSFVYITPYLTEVTRIRKACPELQFTEPSDKLKAYNYTKYSHLAALLASGANIATTHAMFCNFKPELLGLIRSGHYTLIIDEAVDVFRELKIKEDDVNLMNRVGWLDENGNSVVSGETVDYRGKRFSDLYEILKNGNLVGIEDGNKLKRDKSAYYWVMVPDFFNSFDDVYILTYLFPAQTLKYYFDMQHIDFRYIGIEHPEEGVYRFTDSLGYIPDYVGELSSKIHICEHKKLNSIGDYPTAFSVGWLERQKNPSLGGVDKTRKHLVNYFRQLCKDIPAKDRMWSTYSSATKFLRDGGFRNSYVAFNEKATNAYRNKRALAYCVNIFMNPFVKRYFVESGAEVREDEAALSTMIQWIWRSAIRDGKEIWIYLPSKRMRELLQNWIRDEEQKYHEYRQAGDKTSAEEAI